MYAGSQLRDHIAAVSALAWSQGGNADLHLSLLAAGVLAFAGAMAYAELAASDA